MPPPSSAIQKTYKQIARSKKLKCKLLTPSNADGWTGVTLYALSTIRTFHHSSNGRDIKQHENKVRNRSSTKKNTNNYKFLLGF